MTTWVKGILIFVVGVLLGLSFSKDLISPLAKLASGGLNLTPTLSQGERENPAVYLVVDFDDGPVKTYADIPFVTGMTVFDILKKTAEQEQWEFLYDPPGSYGVFLRGVRGRNNGDDGKYWIYWVNASYGMVAADRYVLTPGDTVLWKFAEEQKIQ